MTVGELEARMSSHELAEWIAYDELSPIGPERADWRAGMLASVLATALGGKKQYKPVDFMPEFTPTRKKRQGDVNMLMAFRAGTGAI